MRSNPYPPPQDGRPKKGEPEPGYEGKTAAFPVAPVCDCGNSPNHLPSCATVIERAKAANDEE